MKNSTKNIILVWCYRLVCLTTLMTVWGCAGGAHVIPDVRIPEPLVESFPLTVGIYYSPELTEYIHDEKIGRYGRFVVELGDNQKQVFESSLGAVFDELVTLESLEDTGVEVAGIFNPSIVGVNVSIPAVTGSDYFEVWIRYDLRLLKPDGTLIHRWLVPAFGKVNRRDFGNVMERSNNALLQATENALRDASTRMIINFHPNLRPDKVSNWINVPRSN